MSCRINFVDGVVQSKLCSSHWNSSSAKPFGREGLDEPIAGVDADLLRLSREDIGPGIVFQIQRDVSARVPDGEHRRFLRPFPRNRGIARGVLVRVPPRLVDDEDVF
jgi:hypothetical protein